MRDSFSKLGRLLALTTLALATSAGAQHTGLQPYEVELILFRHLSSTATPEDWRLEAAMAGRYEAATDEQALDDEAPAPPPANAPSARFPALSPERFKLTAITDTLRRSRNYRPLAHLGWTQPGFPLGEVRYMGLEGLVPAGSGIGGRVALTRGRYLHLTLDLTFRSPETGELLILRQTRRMRSNERHYIDHPKFGVIALITPAAQ